ncbi:MAG: threonine/serine dehydratase [Acidobacteriota bacterium]|nr:threonine/serine dehydratase [Acidobacteriota bacterium]
MPPLLTLAEIHAAQRRIAGVATRTSLQVVSPERLQAAGVPALPFALFIKAESEQPIGSFKLRGAYNRIAQLSPGELSRGVITYSSGNHAQGVAYAARALGAQAVIVMPDNAPLVKIEATRALGAEVVFVGPASAARKARAEELAAAHGYAVIPPYDDPAIIAGQATCGVEIIEQLDRFEQLDAPEQLDRHGAAPPQPGATLVLSPVSGGGLLSGIATGVKLTLAEFRARTGTAPDVQVWGAEPELAADAKQSFDTRTLVEWPAASTTRTLADGLRTQSLGQLNFDHILRFVDGIVTVTEDEIRRAMQILHAATGLVAEPSGAVTLAAALFHHAELAACTRLVAVVSGGNIEPALREELALA